MRVLGDDHSSWRPMSQRWSVCSVCSKSFVPRFTYQAEASDSVEPRYFCSIACRAPELTTRQHGNTSGHSGLHACMVCAKRFEMRFAFQVVVTPRTRRVVCSEACRATLLAGDRPSEAPKRAPVRAIAVLNQKGGTGKTTTAVSISAG